MTNHIVKARGLKIKNAEETRKLLSRGDLISPSDALNLGLVDEVINPDEYILREFGKEQYIDVVQKNWK